MYITDRLRKFIEEFKAPILSKILSDKDFNFAVFYENKEISYNKRKFTSTESSSPPIILTKDILEYETLKRGYLSLRFKNNIFSSKYIITEELIETIQIDDSFFGELSKANNVNWNIDLIQKYKHRWNWKYLSGNITFPWNYKTIEKYSDLIDFKILSSNSGLRIHPEYLEREHLDKWNWGAISNNPTLAIYEERYHWDSYSNRCPLWNKKLIWTPNKKKYDSADGIFKDIEPCVCTNTGLKWDLETFEFHRDKIDFWLLAYFGNINIEVIQKYGEELNENRIVRTLINENNVKIPIFRNGWENLFLNPSFSIYSRNSMILNPGGIFFINSFLFDENQRLKTYNKIEMEYDSFTKKTKQIESKTPISNLIKPNQINLDLETLSSYYYIFNENIINENSINHTLYTSIIKPAFLKERRLVQLLFI